MQGFETLWLPGMDHAGIATQNVVERQLRARPPHAQPRLSRLPRRTRRRRARSCHR
ncbi:class I tRNA ligase family protein [Micromonospora profundi]